MTMTMTIYGYDYLARKDQHSLVMVKANICESLSPNLIMQIIVARNPRKLLKALNVFVII